MIGSFMASIQLVKERNLSIQSLQPQTVADSEILLTGDL